MVNRQWQKITDIIEETARTYSIDDAIYLANRLLGMNDERIVQILGDYYGEPIPETSIKGMLNRILIVLQSIDAKLETVEYNVGVTADNTTVMLKHGEYRSNNSDYWDTYRRTVVQAYRYRGSRVYGSDGHVFEFTSPLPAKMHPTHSGTVGSFVRIPQNAMLGIEPQVVTTFKISALRYGKGYNLPWRRMWINLYSAPEYMHSAFMTSFEPVVIDGNEGYALFHVQLNYLDPLTDYIWLQVLINVPEDDWSYPDMAANVIELRVEQIAGQVLG